MLLVSVVVGLVPALGGWLILRCITPTALGCLLGSGFCCGVYYLGLARGYESGDFTTVYPAARGLPVLMLGLADAARGHLPTAWGWMGMFVVAIGCFMVPQRSFRQLHVREYLHHSVPWIVLTALGTVGYSVLDKIGLENTRTGPAEAAIYGYMFFVVSAITYLALNALFRSRIEGPPRIGWRLPAVAAVCNFGAYWLILWSFQLTDRVSYVVAFRQFSIVIGVTAAVVLFREDGRLIRTLGAVVIAAGLIVLKLFGS